MSLIGGTFRLHTLTLFPHYSFYHQVWLFPYISFVCSFILFRRVIQASGPLIHTHRNISRHTEALRCSNWGDNVLVIKSIMKFPVCGNCLDGGFSFLFLFFNFRFVLIAFISVGSLVFFLCIYFHAIHRKLAMLEATKQRRHTIEYEKRDGTSRWSVLNKSVYRLIYVYTYNKCPYFDDEQFSNAHWLLVLHRSTRRQFFVCSGDSNSSFSIRMLRKTTNRSFNKIAQAKSQMTFFLLELPISIDQPFLFDLNWLDCSSQCWILF